MEIIMITICVDDWQRWKRKKDRNEWEKKRATLLPFFGRERIKLNFAKNPINSPLLAGNFIAAAAAAAIPSHFTLASFPLPPPPPLFAYFSPHG